MKAKGQAKLLRRTAAAALACVGALALAFPGLASSPGVPGQILMQRGGDTYAIDPRHGYLETTPIVPGGDATWSPSGNAIAFSLNDGQYDIYVARGDGGDPVQITKTSANERHATWSPDGRQIAFSSNRDGDYDIYVMNADGTNVRNLTNGLSTADDYEPNWSPDGSLIAFQTFRGNWEIYTIRPDGTDARDVSNSAYADGPTDWSPDSSTILFETNRGSWDVFAVGADGTNPHPVVTDASADGNAIYSPDGMSIAFVSNRSGHYETYVSRADGSAATQVTTGDRDVALGSWQSLTDQQAPTVHAYPITVVRGKPIVARLTTTDNDARLRVQTRLPGIAGLSTFAYETWRTFPIGQKTKVALPSLTFVVRFLGKRVPAKSKYCVRVTDASANVSPQSCATLTLVTPKPKKRAA